MVSQFVLHGAREALAGGMLHIEEQIKSLELAIIENPGLAFDLARTLIESVCKTILNERRVAFNTDDDLPKLFKAVTSKLSFLPASASGEIEARRNLEKTLGGLHTTLQGICELRNLYGFASHGAGEKRPTMETTQALLAAQAADAIVRFLYRVHHQDRVIPRESRLDYKDNPSFNEYVDEANEPVHIFDLVYTPSEVLFTVDEEAYRNLLINFMPAEETSESSPSSNSSAEKEQ